MTILVYILCLRCLGIRNHSPLEYIFTGMLLCVCIVFCNITVMRSLCYKGTQNKIREPVLMRRMSRSASKMSNSSTREEIAFGRLMGFLCVIFVGCWMPQMVSLSICTSVRYRLNLKFYSLIPNKKLRSNDRALRIFQFRPKLTM